MISVAEYSVDAESLDAQDNHLENWLAVGKLVISECALKVIAKGGARHSMG